MTDDDRIAALFEAPGRGPDDRFVLRIERALLAERRIEKARRGAWMRFGIEIAASGAVVAAFVLLGRLAPGLPAVGPVGPAAAAVLLLACWFAVGLRPAAPAGR
jgi:hypothetical protein